MSTSQMIRFPSLAPVASLVPSGEKRQNQTSSMWCVSTWVVVHGNWSLLKMCTAQITVNSLTGSTKRLIRNITWISNENSEFTGSRVNKYNWVLKTWGELKTITLSEYTTRKWNKWLQIFTPCSHFLNKYISKYKSVCICLFAWSARQNKNASVIFTLTMSSKFSCFAKFEIDKQ